MKRKQNKSLSHERFNSLFSKSKTYRPLFCDVETFDDLYARNTDIELEDKNDEQTKRIVKKTSKLTIIEPTFINFLHQLNPEMKNLYNDIKNLLLSYENMSSKMEKYLETFKVNRKLEFNICFVGNYIQVNYNKVTYNIDVDKKIKLLDDEIQIIMNEHKVNKIANYQKVDYITEFPQLDKCIIMDEEIVGNLPFKTLKK
jgi:hypothetical protein